MSLLTGFRINDFRVRHDNGLSEAGGPSAFVLVDGLNIGAEMFNNLTPLRAGLMLSVFNTGRDCYWLGTGIPSGLTTIPVAWPGDTSQSIIDCGVITEWHVHIPTTGDVTFYFELAGGEAPKPTSGSAAAGWAKISPPEDRAATVLALLGSRFRYYNKGDILNTFYTDGLWQAGGPRPPLPKPPSPYLQFVKTRTSAW